MSSNVFSNIGPCSITWVDVTGGTDLGKTEGDVTVTFTQTFAEMFNDQDGVGPVDGIITGATLESVTPFSEMNVTNLQKLLASATLTPSTGQDGTLTVKGGVGVEMYNGAYVLELTRWVGGVVSTDQDDVITVLKAFPIPDFELAFGKENQRVVNVMWKCFPSLDTGDIGVYYRVGAT